MNRLQRLLHRPFFIKLLNWEYWNFHAVYGPLYPAWLWLCLRSRSFFFFAASNPSIETGGFLNESKKDLAVLIPLQYQPRTVFFPASTSAVQVLDALQEQGLQFPLIGKPDVGGKGRGVKTLHTPHDVKAYVEHAPLNFHIQEFVPYKEEAGIFYYRYPGEATGRISGIVRKEFMSVTGDGVHTIRQLLARNKRAILQQHSLEEMIGKGLDDILPAGEEKVLVPYGNHARGARFLDDTHLVDEELTAAIDKVCREIPEFYYGRLDIRYRDWEALKKGTHFAIIEVNGAGSEPTHIYDPRHSVFFAWREIVRHWVILGRISRMNRRRGYPYLSFKEGVAMFKEDKAHSQKLAAMPR